MAYDFTQPQQIAIAIELYRSSDRTAADPHKSRRLRGAAERRLVLGLPIMKEMLRKRSLAGSDRDYFRNLINRIEQEREIADPDSCQVVTPP